MSEALALTLDSRTTIGKKVNRLRRAGILPATVYGKGVGPFSVQVDARTFSETYRRAGRTRLVELSIPGQPKQSAFIYSVQRHPVTRAIIHADFLVVDLKTELIVSVPVHVVGESPLVEQGIAVVNLMLQAVDVRALPADIPSNVEVDISGLDSLDKNIHVSDLVVPGNAVVVNEADEVVVSITPIRGAEEEEAVEAEAPAEPELVREKREEEEE